MQIFCEAYIRWCPSEELVPHILLVGVHLDVAMSTAGLRDILHRAREQCEHLGCTERLRIGSENGVNIGER